MFKAGHIDGVPQELWRRCDAIMLWHVLPMDGRVLDIMERCRVIVRAGVGYDSIDLAACGAAASRCATCPTTARARWPTTPSRSRWR